MYYFFSSVFVFESKILNLTFSSHHLADEDKLKNKNIPSRFDYSGFHVIFYFPISICVSVSVSVSFALIFELIRRKLQRGTQQLNYASR